LSNASLDIRLGFWSGLRRNPSAEEPPLPALDWRRHCLVSANTASASARLSYCHLGVRPEVRDRPSSLLSQAGRRCILRSTPRQAKGRARSSRPAAAYLASDAPAAVASAITYRRVRPEGRPASRQSAPKADAHLQARTALMATSSSSRADWYCPAQIAVARAPAPRQLGLLRLLCAGA